MGRHYHTGWCVEPLLLYYDPMYGAHFCAVQSIGPKLVVPLALRGVVSLAQAVLYVCDALTREEGQILRSRFAALVCIDFVATRNWRTQAVTMLDSCFELGCYHTTGIVFEISWRASSCC